MSLLRFSTALLFTVAWPCLLYAQSNPGSDSTLSLDNAVQTLDQEFREAPVWRQGAVNVMAPIRPLSDPSFSWAAGYIWSHPPIGVAAEWPPSGKKFSAWTSNGAIDADPNGDMIAKIGEAGGPSAYVLQSGSPAIGAGVVISGHTRDYYANVISGAPSIGADFVAYRTYTDILRFNIWK